MQVRTYNLKQNYMPNYDEIIEQSQENIKALTKKLTEIDEIYETISSLTQTAQEIPIAFENKFKEIVDIDINFIQDNEALSNKGTLRGLHFQEGDHAQAKLVQVVKGEVLDVIVDLRKNSATFGEHITIELSDTKIRIEVNGVVLLSKLIEGTFPDYERVIPQNNDKRLTVDTASFKQAVDRVSTIASDRGGKAVKLAIGNGLLEMSVTNPDHGTAREELPIEFEDEGFEIGFNARYLLDIIDQVKSEAAIFMLSDSGSPTLIRDTSSSGALYVLMPMRV